MTEPTRILTFTGTRVQFMDYLRRELVRTDPAAPSDPEAYEWELTASIARHPAGKGLGRG